MKHLIKRKDFGYAVTAGWYCEVSINRSTQRSLKVPYCYG